MMSGITAKKGIDFAQAGTGGDGVILIDPVTASFEKRKDGLVEELFFSELVDSAEEHVRTPDGDLWIKYNINFRLIK